MNASIAHDQQASSGFRATHRVILGVIRRRLVWALVVGMFGGGLTLPALPAAAQGPLDPQTYDLSMAKGLIRYSNGQYSEAEQLFRAALAAYPGDRRASFYFGQTLIRLKRPEAAQDIFQQLLRKDPNDGRAWLGLGMAQYNRGQYTRR